MNTNEHTPDLPQFDAYRESAREEVGKHIPVGCGSAIDVGCGSGGFGVTLRRVLGRDARIVGMEPVDIQRERAVNHGVYDAVLDGYFPTGLNAGHDKYDLIVFNDVLEHIIDPETTLNQAREFLKPNGYVLAAIPNIQFFPVIIKLIRGRWDYTDDGVLDRTHVRFFTRNTMIELFENSGFEVRTISGENTPFELSPKFRRVRFLKRVFGNSKWMHFVVVAQAKSPK